MKLTENRLRVFEFIRDSNRWLDVNQIAHHTSFSHSLVSRCVRSLAKEGVVVKDDTFPAYLYRIADGHEQTPLTKQLEAGLNILDMRTKD